MMITLIYILTRKYVGFISKMFLKLKKVKYIFSPHNEIGNRRVELRNVGFLNLLIAVGTESGEPDVRDVSWEFTSSRTR